MAAMTTMLLVGAADTGRAPIAAALLRRLLEHEGLAWQVGSAGVLGHDGAPPETEARDAMAHAGLDIAAHMARSVGDELVAEAALLVAIDSGIARVLRGRFPDAAERIVTLGELAGRGRDIPDPFRMQIGAWLTYTRELGTLLEAALPRMRELAPAAAPALAPEKPSAAPAAAAPADSSSERAAATTRMTQLLDVAAAMPHVLDWAAARAQIEADIARAAVPMSNNDLAAVYADLARAVLALSAAPPTPGQIAGLRAVAERFGQPVQQDALAWLSSQIATWAGP